MTAKLLIREVGQREFVQHNGDFLDDPVGTAWSGGVEPEPAPRLLGEEKADAEGERLTLEGNVEAYQVWTLVATKQRVWKLEEVAA